MTTQQKPALGLFAAWGIEIEYMIVDRTSLDVRPLADVALRDFAGAKDGSWPADVRDGAVEWSNELVGHVVEVKCAEPARTLAGLAAEFDRSVAVMQKRLADHGAMLMGSGMHPWMDPREQTKLWPHEGHEIYAEYDRLFDCHRHGWANLQSMHLNLPFADEREFARLMAAVRLVVPLVPALAASSPVVESRRTRRLDSRLSFYRTNAQRVPAMAGDVVPEPVFAIEPYRHDVLAPINAQLRAIGAAPDLLARDWLNARGAIARFDRMAIEIRVADAQERPRADVAVAAAISGLVQHLVEGRGSSFEEQAAAPAAVLQRTFRRALRNGPDAAIDSAEVVSLFGFETRSCKTAGDVWRHFLERHFEGPAELEAPLDVILTEGTLAERILGALGADFDARDLALVYRRLSQSLVDDRPFRA